MKVRSIYSMETLRIKKLEIKILHNSKKEKMEIIAKKFKDNIKEYMYQPFLKKTIKRK
jgi:hypothetical protein